MSQFGNNLSLNILSAIKSFGKQAKEALTKANQQEQPNKSLQQGRTTPSQSLSNTNSNIPLNQQTLTNTALNQTALNTTNQTQLNLKGDLKNTLNNQVQPTPTQADFHGPSDLPAYAGIANMSLKTWIAGQDNKNMVKIESGEKQLNTTLEGIKGFQRQNYEGFGDGSDKNKGNRSLEMFNKRKNLLILSQIFSCAEQPLLQETELIVNINSFKKLGSFLSDSGSSPEEKLAEIKLSPPFPEELHRLNIMDPMQIKYLHQLLALPSEFPECLRLFAKENTVS